jgi:hypothetical protein
VLSLSHSSAQDFTITQYDVADAQIMQFAETTDGQVYYLYFDFDLGFLDHRLLAFDGTTWTPVSRPCERCINDLLGAADGQLYAAADEEILRYSTTEDSWSTYLAEPAFRLVSNPAGTITFINTDGAFDYDGTTVTARNNANAPEISNARAAVYDPNGDLYVIMNGSVYRQNTDDGWQALSDITSPLHLALAPDGKVYVTDNFGDIHYYENQSFTENVLDGVFPSFFIGLKGFGINQNGIFWGATQGIGPALIRHDPSTTTDEIPTDDLIPGSNSLTIVFVASNNLVFVASNFTTYVTTVDDGTVTSVFDLKAPELNFSLRPNPSQGRTQRHWDHLPTGTGTVEIFNTIGQRYYRQSVEITGENGQLDLITSALPAGSYWLLMRVGNAFGRQQLIVK